MTTTTSRPTMTPQVFYRRHNTLPRFPGPAGPVGRRPHPGRRPARTTAPTTAATATTSAGPGLLLVDLTSPWAYLAHLRLDRPELDLAERPTWCAVQPWTGRPLLGARAPGAELELVRKELARVRELALPDEELPDDVPPVLPHPRPVTAAYAEAVELGRGPQARELLLRAYWLEGLDIGDPEVLRRLLPAALVDDRAPCSGDPRREWGYVVSSARGPLSDGAYHRMRRWQRRWENLGAPGPLVRLGPAGTRTGAAALGALPAEPGSSAR